MPTKEVTRLENQSSYFFGQLFTSGITSLAAVLPNVFTNWHGTVGEREDKVRETDQIYQYLCHLEEARKWIEDLLHEKLPGSTLDCIESLKDGSVLCRLANDLCPELENNRWMSQNDAAQDEKTNDNLDHWFQFLESIKLAKDFYPERNVKNTPWLIYSLKAVSRHLFRLGKAPPMSDLYGKFQFTDTQIDAMSQELKELGVPLPPFKKIGGLLANEFQVDKAMFHASVVAINEALDHEDIDTFLNTLKDPSACLNGIVNEHVQFYLERMRDVKQAKYEVLQAMVAIDSLSDNFEEMLTQDEVQGHITSVNLLQAWKGVWQAVQAKNEDALFIELQAFDLKGTREICCPLYMNILESQFNNEASFINTIDCLECRLLLQQAITDGNNTMDDESSSVANFHPKATSSPLSGGDLNVDWVNRLCEPHLNQYKQIREADGACSFSDPECLGCYFSKETKKLNTPGGEESLDEPRSAQSIPSSGASTTMQPLSLYRYNELDTRINKKYPDHDIDRMNLEKHLGDWEFTHILGYSKQDWETIPPWKRQELKKKHYLF